MRGSSVDHGPARHHTKNLEMAIGLLGKIARERGIPELNNKLVKSLDELKLDEAAQELSDEAESSVLENSDSDDPTSKSEGFFEKALPKDQSL